MPLEGEHGIVANHAASVVGDLNKFFPARLDADLDARRARVERVLQQLLHDRGRALHHLASSDLIGNGFGENVNSTHGRRSLAAPGISAAGSRCAHARKSPQPRQRRSYWPRFRRERGYVPWGSSQFSVLSSQFSVLSSQFSVLSSQFSVLSSQQKAIRVQSSVSQMTGWKAKIDAGLARTDGAGHRFTAHWWADILRS